MNRFVCVAPCHFGLEAVLKREIVNLGYEIESVEDGRVTFSGDEYVVPMANIFLRTADRVLLKVGEFTAKTFEELFENTKAIPWEQYVPVNGKVWVTKATSVRSTLHATVPIQSVMKKAMVNRLLEKHHTDRLPETGVEIPVRVSVLKDKVLVGLDTSGEPLHKRGYRAMTVKAPISETMAAALLMLTPWKKDRMLTDPFCGSGTFPIEAAMMARNIAPGKNRTFLAETWTHILPKKVWSIARQVAAKAETPDVSLMITGTDIDPEAIKAAKENARAAGVGDAIRFSVRPVERMAKVLVEQKKPYGFVVTNPPYGERLSDREEVKVLYETLAAQLKELPTWSLYAITSSPDFEEAMGRPAAKKRKLYNGMLKTCFYSYPGPKPDREKKEST